MACVNGFTTTVVADGISAVDYATTGDFGLVVLLGGLVARRSRRGVRHRRADALLVRDLLGGLRAGEGHQVQLASARRLAQHLDADPVAAGPGSSFSAGVIAWYGVRPSLIDSSEWSTGGSGSTCCRGYAASRLRPGAADVASAARKASTVALNSGDVAAVPSRSSTAAQTARTAAAARTVRARRG